jgi:hypothetical protein
MQRKFAIAYARTGNAFQSALEAGYSKGYANTKAGLLVRNGKVRAVLQEIGHFAQEKKKIARAALAVNEVDEMVANIVRFHQGDYEVLLPDGTTTVEFNKDLPNSAAVKSVTRKVSSKGTGDGSDDACVIGVEPYDKLRAIEMYYKRHGYLANKDTVTHNVDGVFADVLEAVLDSSRFTPKMRNDQGPGQGAADQPRLAAHDTPSPDQ